MLKVFAPAKINLHLHVTGRQDNGYHALDSLVCFADIGDTLSFEAARGFHLHVEGNFSGHLTQGDLDPSPSSNNSVVKAARLLAGTLGRELNVKITLQKNLPPGGGIGGGSADAAATLWGLCQFWNLNMADEALKAIALKIGSDVPSCLKSLPLLMQGAGETILPAPDLPEIPIVLAWPRQPASTPTVYAALNMRKFSTPFSFKPYYESAETLISDLTFQTTNDLAETARGLHPVIEDAEDIMALQTGCAFARMSGSGSTVFGLFKDEDFALAASENILKAHPEWWVRHGWLNRTARY